MATTYAGEGNPRDFDQVDYGNGIIGKKVDGGWLYPWRKDPYQDVLSDSDIASQQQITAYRTSNPGMHVAEDDQTAWDQMTGKQPLNTNDAQGNNSGSANATPSQQWAGTAATATPATPGLPVTGTPTDKAAPNTQMSTLYDLLLQRINQPLTPDKNDPTIRGQADAYSAAATRAGREYLANQAEAMGPFANLSAEARLVAERAGQSSGQFEAGLIGSEQDKRRAEAQHALDTYGGALTDEQRLQLEEELGLRAANTADTRTGNDYSLGVMGNATTQRGQNMTYDEFLRELGLREWDMGNQDDYRRLGI